MPLFPEVVDGQGTPGKRFQVILLSDNPKPDSKVVYRDLPELDTSGYRKVPNGEYLLGFQNETYKVEGSGTINI